MSKITDNDDTLLRCECCGKRTDDCRRDAVGLHCYACRRWAAEMMGVGIEEDEDDEKHSD